MTTKPSRVLVAYASAAGSTAGIAERIAEVLRTYRRDWSSVEAWAHGIAASLAVRGHLPPLSTR